jgi:hypothetical protein
MFKIEGTIRYSPKLVGSKTESKWWMIVDCDPTGEMGRYYRHLYHVSTHRCRRIQAPSWALHITVVRDEKPSRPWLWGLYSGRKVEVEYEPLVRSGETYYWLDVTCPVLLDVREELGLERHPLYPLHLSIGHDELGVDISECV